MKTKAQLLVLFSLSWIVVIFGIIRCVELIKVSIQACDTIVAQLSRQWLGLIVQQTEELELSQSGPWSVRESFLAMIISNAPIVIPLLRRWFMNVTGLGSSQAKSSKDGSYTIDSNAKSSGLGSRGPQRSKDSKKKKKFHHPLSLPTKWGSDEEITMDQQTMGTGGRGEDVKGTRDNISEITAEEPHTTIELDDLPSHPRHEVRVSKQMDKSQAGDHPGDIMVTREWEVAKGQGKVKNPELYSA